VQEARSEGFEMWDNFLKYYSYDFLGAELLCTTDCERVMIAELMNPKTAAWSHY